MFPLADDISKCFGGVKTLITNDANAATIGEMIYGNAKGMKNFIMITLGTGVGSGFVANGEMIYGHDGFAGEFGHVIVERNGRECGCGRRGCLEAYVSATGIKRTAFELMARMTAPSRLRSIAYDDFDASMVSAAAEQGDPVALEAFRFTGEMLGRALADIVTVTSPEAIFLFGGLAKAGKLLFRADAMVHGGEHDERLQEQGETASQRHSGQECRHPRRLGADLAGYEIAPSARAVGPSGIEKEHSRRGALLFSCRCASRCGRQPGGCYLSRFIRPSSAVASRIERAKPPPQAIVMSSVVRDDTRPVRIS